MHASLYLFIYLTFDERQDEDRQTSLISIDKFLCFKVYMKIYRVDMDNGEGGGAGRWVEDGHMETRTQTLAQPLNVSKVRRY